MIGFCPLASGSKGNALYFGSKETKVLIDAGISARQIILRLDQIGIKIEEIEAILITHEHTDHIGGLSTLLQRYSIPLFANSNTAKAMMQVLACTPKFKIFSTGESFEFADLEITPFSIQHDTVDPVAFTIKTEGVKVGICTDLGFVTTHVIDHLQGCDYLYVEANHEPSMVHACGRPDRYKQRVLSRQGHLSNAQCAELLEAVRHKGLKHVHLAHLSSECNAPERALMAVQEKWRGEIPLSIAFQDCVSHPVLFEQAACAPHSTL